MTLDVASDSLDDGVVDGKDKTDEIVSKINVANFANYSIKLL